MTTPRRLNLNIGVNTTGYVANAWRHRTGTRGEINDLAYYRRLTEAAHRGRLCSVFFSDHPALMLDPNGRPFHTLDPLILCAALAAQVPDIGFVATVSSTYNSPYNFARRTQSLDIVSGGRLIVNVVSSFNPDVAANFGSAPLPPRTERYARASEFLDVAKRLWSSWDPSREPEPPEDRFWTPAIAAPRICATSDTIWITNRILRATEAELKRRGYPVKRSPYNYYFGGLHGIRIVDGRPDGAADPGRDGMALAV